MAIAPGTRRIAVVLDPEVDRALTRVAKLQGRAVASVVREVLREAAPVFESMADALELARTSPARAVQRMVRTFDQAQAEAQQAVFPLRRKRGRPKKG